MGPIDPAPRLAVSSRNFPPDKLSMGGEEDPEVLKRIVLRHFYLENDG
jgi:hypothetical protein